MAIDDLYRKACEAVERANYGYAVELYREVLRQQPEHLDARVALRGTERRRAQESPPSVAHKILSPLILLVTSLRASIFSRNPAKRLERYEDFLERNPNSFPALFGAARAARAAGFNVAASTILKDALKLKPNHKAGLRLLSAVLEETGNRKEALSYLMRLAQLQPHDRNLELKIRDLQATDHMKTFKIEEAKSFRDLTREKAEGPAEAETGKAAQTEPLTKQIELARKDLEQDPENTTKITRLAGLYEDRGDYEQAETVLKESLEGMPDNYMVRECLGDMQFRARQRAIKRVKEQLEKEPERADLKQKLSQMRQEFSEFAVKEYTWRVGRHPTDLDLQFKLGQALYELGNANEAIAAFQRSSSSPGLAADSARMLGLCFMRKNQYDLAAEQYERAIQRHPQLDDKGKDLLYHLAEAHDASGDKEKALQLYKKIYSTDINFRDVAQKVDALSR